MTFCLLLDWVEKCLHNQSLVDFVIRFVNLKLFLRQHFIIWEAQSLKKIVFEVTFSVNLRVYDGFN